MKLCNLALIVIVLAIVSLVLSIYINGITDMFLFDFLFMALLVFLANRYCDSWIAKGIVIYAILGTSVGVYCLLVDSSICNDAYGVQKYELTRPPV
jgi:peptidoglycan/LPS O-acetylase OafA/YrhL